MAISWTKTSGSFPPGVDIVVDSTAAAAYIRGNPSRTGTYNFQITATDIDGSTASKDYTLQVTPKLRKIGEYAYQTQLPTGTTNVPYLFTQKIGIEDIGVTSESTFNVSVISGSLPPGVSINIENAGLQPSAQVGYYDYAWINFSGNPTSAGTYSFILRATSGSRFQDFNLSIPIQSPYIQPPPTQPITYTLGADKTYVNEGDTVTFTLVTTGIPNGTSIPYTITGVQSSDVIGGALTGNFVVQTYTEYYPLYQSIGGIYGEWILGYETYEYTAASVTVTLAADFTTEGTETMRLYLSNVSPFTYSDVYVADTSVTPVVPTYNLVASTSSVTEGQSFTITLNTTFVSDGTYFPYYISGVSSADINFAPLNGGFQVYGGQASITFTSRVDSIVGAKSFYITIPSLGYLSVSVTINDPAPTYNLVPNATSVAEGQYITFNLYTTTVADGTNIGYTIGGVSSADLSGAALSGAITVFNNFAGISFLVANDFLSEGNETLQFNLPALGISRVVTIVDTSLTPQPVYNLYTYDVNGTTLNGSVGITEGQIFNIAVTGYNIPLGTRLNYSITGINQNQISIPLNGTIGIDYDVYGTQYGFIEATTYDDGVIGQNQVTISLPTLGLVTAFPLSSPAAPPPNDVPVDSGGSGGTGGGGFDAGGGGGVVGPDPGFYDYEIFYDYSYF